MNEKELTRILMILKIGCIAIVGCAVVLMVVTTDPLTMAIYATAGMIGFSMGSRP